MSLSESVFHLQQLQTVPIARREKRLGDLTEAEFGLVKDNDGSTSEAG